MKTMSSYKEHLGYIAYLRQRARYDQTVEMAQQASIAFAPFLLWTPCAKRVSLELYASKSPF